VQFCCKNRWYRVPTRPDVACVGGCSLLEPDSARLGQRPLSLGDSPIARTCGHEDVIAVGQAGPTDSAIPAFRGEQSWSRRRSRSQKAMKTGTSPPNRGWTVALRPRVLFRREYPPAVQTAVFITFEFLDRTTLRHSPGRGEITREERERVYYGAGTGSPCRSSENGTVLLTFAFVGDSTREVKRSAASTGVNYWGLNFRREIVWLPTVDAFRTFVATGTLSGLSLAAGSAETRI
jgi:hypothetical protein